MSPISRVVPTTTWKRKCFVISCLFLCRIISLVSSIGCRYYYFDILTWRKKYVTDVLNYGWHEAHSKILINLFVVNFYCRGDEVFDRHLSYPSVKYDEEVCLDVTANFIYKVWLSYLIWIRFYATVSQKLKDLESESEYWK